MTARIVGVEWAATEDWAVWNVGQAAQHAERIAATRLAQPDLVHAAAAGIRALDQLAQETPGTWSLGVWLPDTTTGAAAGTLMVRTVAPDGPHRMTQDELLVWAARPPRRGGTRILDVDVAPGQVAAGPAVLQVLETVPRLSRRITTRFSWFVLPPGTEDLVLCQFETEQPALAEALSWETNTVTDNLVVRLEQEVAP